MLFEAGSNSRRIVDEFFLREQIEPRIVTETENVEILKNLARAGLGVTIVPYQAGGPRDRRQADLLRAHPGP